MLYCKGLAIVPDIPTHYKTVREKFFLPGLTRHNLQGKKTYTAVLKHALNLVVLYLAL